MTHDIHVWTITAAPDGSPRANERPLPRDLEACDAAMRLNPSTRRHSVEAVRTDVATARRLAAEVLRAARPDAASWREVPHDDLAAPPPPTPAERIDIGAATPSDPQWPAEARAMLAIGGYDPDDPSADPEVRETARTLIERALRESWSIRELGRAVLTARADAQDALGPIDPRHALPNVDPVAFASGAADTRASVWNRVIRAPDRERGELTNATRRAF
jgi:hypothetical protein